MFCRGSSLAKLCNQSLRCVLSALTIGVYVFVYTPIKRVTTLNTIVGAIPGALPPVIGWTAARGHAGFESWIFFAILFLWQMPHFLSISWLYREDYKKAGFVMLASFDPACCATGRQSLLYGWFRCVLPQPCWSSPVFGISRSLV